jgi:FemAB-related protein (PEP-CTERM system-associated)
LASKFALQIYNFSFVICHANDDDFDMSVEVHAWTSSDLEGELPRLESYFLRGVAHPELGEGREEASILSTPFEDSARATPMQRSIQGQTIQTDAERTGENGLPLSRHPGWLLALRDGLRHIAYCLEAREGETSRGLLPLAYVHSLFFGRFLVSLPYLNIGGVLADNLAIANLLVDRAVQLADELKVRYLELRHEQPINHPALTAQMTDKVHMRLPLPPNSQELWNHLPSKVRNQVRKAQKINLTVEWGNHDLLPEFYQVFSENMRDLGTPVYGKIFFQRILDQFSDHAELAVVRHGRVAVAVALLLHGWGISEVPSASSLRHYRASNANMLLYWHLLERTIKRGNHVFDFGRSSKDSNTYRFKKQWGAHAESAVWQYYLRHGSIHDLRPENPKYQSLSRIWQRLPLSVTRWIGPKIVRGIP